MTGPADRPHLTSLGPGWGVWRDVALRSTGFPADGVRRLTDPELAAAADAVLDERTASTRSKASPAKSTGNAASTGKTGNPGSTAVSSAGAALVAAFRAEYAAAGDRLSAAIAKFAGDGRFREAVAWQNPKLVKLCLDKLVAGERRNVRGRNHEQTVAAYLQRYSLKNDTVGFVGPVGWARWTDAGGPLTVAPGATLLARRRVYFEAWAIEAVARALSAERDIRPWLVPRRCEEQFFDGTTVRVPGRAPASPTPAERALLSIVDGVRQVRDIAAELGDEPAVLAALDSLAARGLVRIDLAGAIETWPERTLLAKLDRIGDSGTRQRARRTVAGLVAARDRVAAAAGDDVALEAAQAELGATFRAITGTDDERRAGQTYAGRTLVYEDTVRDVRVALGPSLRAELSRPLCLLLDSARWLVAEIGQEYDRVFQSCYERRVKQTGDPVVPLAAILSLATPVLYYNPRGLSEPVRKAVAEFQRRWATILRIPPGTGEVRRSSDEIAAGVAELFPARPLPWATGIHHSPDFMLAAAGPDAVARGEHLFVLGELHVSFNTMESRLFVEQHENPPALLAAAEADLGDRRVYGIPGKDLPGVTTRVSPPSALLSPRYTYWARHPVSAVPPGPVLPVADLFVHREGGALIVRSGAAAFEAPLARVLGEQLSAATLNSFKPLAGGAHRPRVLLDRLVIARESWSLPAGEVSWAAVKSPADRFLGAREWRRRHGLPERAFYRVPVEDKPAFVDFGSIVYVDSLAKSIRRSAAENGSVTLTEMLPDQSQLWLPDADGDRYTSEFRICAVDRVAELA